jgi:hypothetical protein
MCPLLEWYTILIILAVLPSSGRWLLESGIQNPDGGVARYYLNAERRPLPVSNEITGYMASAYAYLYQRTGEQVYLGRAWFTARFLTERAWNPELQTFPFEPVAGSPGYFFDCGIIVRGLLAVWRLTHEQRLREIALAAARSMSRDYLTPTAIHPIIALPSREPHPYEKRWSREPGCFLLKSALAWHELGLEGCWKKALGQAIANDADFLPGVDDRLKVMDRLHPYCYYMEALLAERSPLLAAAIPRTARYLREIAPDFARSDVYAQLLRVRLYAHAYGIVPLDVAAAREEAAAIRTFQYRVPDDPVLHGGFCFGSRGGTLLPYVNPVSTAFCLQALDMWEQYQAGNLGKPDLADLI